MKKALIVATVVKTHIMVFHIPAIKLLKDLGYEVHVCSKNDYDNKDDCKIPYCDKFYDLSFERFPIKINNFHTYRKLKRIINNNNYDLIHCHTPVGGALARLAAFDNKNRNRKVIYTAHGFHFYKGAPIKNWILYYPVEKYLSKFTDVLITINKEDFKRAKKFNAGRVEYIPGVGIDIDMFKNIDVNIEKKRESLGIKKDEFLIISVGELNKNKNHKVVIEAISKLKDESIKYVICGEGPLEEELKELSRKLEVENKVAFLGFRNDIPELLKISDLFVFPSLREGLSLSLMEAMSSGLPVVCSDIRGNVDLIDNGKGGYLVNPDDIEGFFKKIKILANDKEKCRKFGLVNQKNVENYSEDRVLDQLSKVYKDEV